MHTSLIDLQLDYEVSHPTHFLFHLESAFCAGHSILEERLTITPSMKVRTFTDERSGNRFFRLDAPKGLLAINYHGRVERNVPTLPAHLDESPVTAVPDEWLRYLMPSRYCESDVMSRAAQQLFGHLPTGISRVQAIDNWIHDSIYYLPGFSNASTSAQEVFVQRAGVCRDFAHLGITFCRALNIPARLVVGYARFHASPQDFHAVFEAWLSDRWVMFDPTRMAPVERLVRVGTGRDAKDVAFATIFGDVHMTRKALTVDEALTPAAGNAAALGTSLDAAATAATPHAASA